MQLSPPRSGPPPATDDPARPAEATSGEPTPAEATSAETTRDRILRTARDLFAERGYQRTSLQQIADRLRLTKAAILYHFPSKEHLVGALVEPLIGGLEQAVDVASEHPPAVARWVMLEAWVDAMLAHRRSLGMIFHDVSMLTRCGMYPRLMSLAMRAYAVVAGPDATLAEQVRAVQAVATLGDPVVFFDDVPVARLRTEMLAGVRRLLGVDSPGDVSRPGSAPLGSAPAGIGPAASGAAVRSAAPPPGRRRAGRPRVMDAARITAARAMHATGSHSVDEIATALGVSRATVYRHLRQPVSSRNSQL